MHEFLFVSYQGFYCAVCDGVTSKYTLRYKMIMSQKHCRDNVTNSLTALLYLHQNLPNIQDLMNSFIA